MYNLEISIVMLAKVSLFVSSLFLMGFYQSLVLCWKVWIISSFIFCWSKVIFDQRWIFKWFVSDVVKSKGGWVLYFVRNWCTSQGSVSTSGSISPQSIIKQLPQISEWICCLMAVTLLANLLHSIGTGWLSKKDDDGKRRLFRFCSWETPHANGIYRPVWLADSTHRGCAGGFKEGFFLFSGVKAKMFSVEIGALISRISHRSKQTIKDGVGWGAGLIYITTP